MGLNNNGPGRPLTRWAVGYLMTLNTDPSFAVLLFYHHGIRKPLRKENLLYSPSFFQSLDLLPDSIDVLLSRSPRLLLLLRVQGVHVELVNYELEVHLEHLIQAPSEHVYILHKT